MDEAEHKVREAPSPFQGFFYQIGAHPFFAPNSLGMTNFPQNKE
jgi:hypothetical protein